MAKKRGLGDEAEKLLTPAQVVSAAGGGGRPALSVASPPRPERKFRLGNFKIYEDQYYALQDAAIRQQREQGRPGKPDHSRLLREILDGWMKGQIG